MPRPGDFVMMLDGERRPRFIWRTTEVMIKPQSEVDEAVCLGSAAHRRYFALGMSALK